MEKGIELARLSDGERDELIALGVLSQDGFLQEYVPPLPSKGYRPVCREAVSSPDVLNEAFMYPIPSSFSRALRVELKDATMLFISGTASVDEDGKSAHVGDFRAQCWRTYRNITRLLESAGASWRDVVRCTCFLRDIERDYADFNRVRTAFFGWLGLNPLPASVGIQARLCREDLLIEIEALAILQREDS